MRWIITFSCLLYGIASAADVQSSQLKVDFHIAHPAKQYDAHLLPDGGKAVLHVDPNDLSALGLDFELRVEKFDSQNSMRDSHMIETMEALIFPTITWSVRGVSGAQGPVAAGTYNLQASGPLVVHGVTQTLTAPVRLEIDASGAMRATSQFSISLESFGIERPTLVFVPIEDTVPITVDIRWPAANVFPQAPPATPTAPPAAEGTTP